MLSKILSVTGRPGLYKLVSSGKNLNIVESLDNGKRIPVHAQEKVVALSDVSIYTQEGDIPLRDVLKKMEEKEAGKQLPLKMTNEAYFAYMEVLLPQYDRAKVYASDIKKLISWYNILMEHHIDLSPDPEAAQEGASEETKAQTEDRSQETETQQEGYDSETTSRKESHTERKEDRPESHSLETTSGNGSHTEKREN